MTCIDKTKKKNENPTIWNLGFTSTPTTRTLIDLFLFWTQLLQHTNCCRLRTLWLDLTIFYHIPLNFDHVPKYGLLCELFVLSLSLSHNLTFLSCEKRVRHTEHNDGFTTRKHVIGYEKFSSSKGQILSPNKLATKKFVGEGWSRKSPVTKKINSPLIFPFGHEKIHHQKLTIGDEIFRQKM